jgi:maleylpyruvate isomerase
MPTLEEEEAFSHLRARQGAGARYDAEKAPAQPLALARRGAAYFARLLNNLGNTELYEASAIPNWTRAHLVAAVAYNAKDITRMVEAARMDLRQIDIPTKSDRAEEIAYASTLPAHALRNLFKHSEVHLNVEWRDLTTANWQATLTTSCGQTIPVLQTPMLRAQAIWSRSIDLNAGGQTSDIPTELKLWSSDGFLRE